MPPVYIVEQGALVNIEGRRLWVERRDSDPIKVPLAHCSSLVVFGNVSLSTPAIKRLLQEGIDVVFLTVHGDYQGRLVGPLTKFGQLRLWQYQRLQDKDFCLKLAQQIIRGKCLNMRTFLMRYNRDLGLPEIASVVERLAEASERCRRTTRLSALLGVEGSASAAYFSVFKRLFKHDWEFPQRVRRPPTDPVNVLLSFGYTLLTRWVETSVALVGLDPMLGIMHTVEYGRPSLALDLVEEFRCIIVDSIVLRCLNSSLITSADFRPGGEGERAVVMSEGAMRVLIREFESRLDTEITHPVTRERLVYRRIFEVQTRLLARCLRDNVPEYQPFVVR